jgi:hypothetical protein
MARIMSTTLSSVGSSKPLNINLSSLPINVSVAVLVSAGAVLTYNVEHMYQDLLASPAEQEFWFPFLTGESTTQDGYYGYPVTAVRLTLTSHTSGSATLVAIQAGTN